MASLARSLLLTSRLSASALQRAGTRLGAASTARSVSVFGSPRCFMPLATQPSAFAPVRWYSEELSEEQLKEKLSQVKPPPADGEEGDEIPDNIKRLVDEITKLNMLEIMILTNHMQERLGITPEMMSASMGSGQAAPAAAPAAGGDGGDGAAEPAEEAKSAFTVKITDLGSGRVKVMKEIRALTGHGLKEVQSLANNLPADVGLNLDKETAEKWAEQLKGAGAVVEIV